MGQKNFWGEDSDIVVRLQAIAALEPGDGGLPDWLPITNWAPVFRGVCSEAAETITALRKEKAESSD